MEPPGSWSEIESRLIDLVQRRRWAPVDTVARLAESMANRAGASLLERDLRLFERATLETDREWDELVAASELPHADALGRFYERLLTPDTRVRSGLHVTPREIARRMVARLDPRWLDESGEDGPPTVLDPAVGGGVFLLAAADALVASGVSPGAAVASQRGCDVDADAVAITEAALGLWVIGHGLEPQRLPAITVADGLLSELPAARVVVGNPPFLNQLRTASAAQPDRRAALRDRWGGVVGAYTDEAWLFLSAAARAVAKGGQISLVQPVSVLAARHGQGVRAEVAERFRLRGLWLADGPVFDASVEVCAPFLIDRDVQEEPVETMQRWRGPELEALTRLGSDADPDAWGRAGAGIAGVPVVRLPAAAKRLGDLATATAGFRDQFYGFAPHVGDDPAPDGRSRPRLVTVGMIDPFRLRWGAADFRFAGRTHRHPVLDLTALDDVDEELAGWVRARQRPKLLVATQTRVLEAWADSEGTAVPATPVISVEPNDSERLFEIAAVLGAPVLSADAAARSFGTALSVRAIKLSARQLLELPIPVDRGAWREGARLAEELQRAGPVRDDVINAFGETMNAAYALDAAMSSSVLAWWRERWPRRNE